MTECARGDPARLANHHRMMFEGLGIPEVLLAKAGIRSVSHFEATQLVGDFHKFDLTGLAFPYFRPGETRPHSHRVRRDNVRGEDPKYIAPPGHRALYFPPGSEILLRDMAAPAVFVESEKTVLALTALVQRAQRRWLVVGLGGCWGWRAKIGIETAPDGSRFPVTGPHPDFDTIVLQGREAIIVFDSNAKSNPKVGKAEREFAKLLQERGAKVRIARIPQSPKVNGPDDYLAAFGDEATLRILDSAIAPGWSGINPWDAALDITSFLNERDSGVEVLEPRVLEREAVTEVFAPRGIGKSEWATELTIRQAKAGRRVLYLDRDNPPRKTRERFRAWGAEGVVGLRVLTRDKIPPLTRADSWALFPWGDYDMLVVDSLDSHAEGVGEQDSSKPSRAIAPLLDISHRDGGPAVLVLGNCIKSGQHSRGSGVVEDRGDFVFEVRDITGWIPTGKKSWWEELPPADAGSWASRASRRKQRERIRLAFVCTKFRGLEEPEPFAFEIDFSTEPRSRREVTDEIDMAGAEAREAHRLERREKLDRAAKLLVGEIMRRQEAGEPVLPKDRGAVPFLVNSGLGRNQARELLKGREGLDWTFQPIEGERGKPLGVFLQSERGAESNGINPISGANQTLSEGFKTAGAEDPHLRHPHEKAPAQMCPDETSINGGDSGDRDLRHFSDLFSPDDHVSDAELWGEL